MLAEGVETLQQQHRLVGAGVRYGQGYLFSRSVPAHDLVGLLGAATTATGTPQQQAPTP